MLAEVGELEPAAIGALAAALSLLGTIPVARATLRLRATTLLLPCVWALAGIWAVAGVEAAIAFASGSAAWSESARFMAAVLGLCPAMAAMGAKRPQQLPWQFIVGSLWAVLSLPALEVLAIHPGQPLEVYGLRSWFLPAIALLGLGNLLGTRYWPSAMLATTALFVLLWGHLPLGGASLGVGGSLFALALADAAILLAACGVPRRRPKAHPLDRLWLDFRDAFGVLWALRLAERVNAAARQYDWDLALHWQGFTRSDGSGTTQDVAPEVLASLRQVLKNLLRRFVSPEWMETYVD